MDDFIAGAGSHGVELPTKGFEDGAVYEAGHTEVRSRPTRSDVRLVVSLTSLST